LSIFLIISNLESEGYIAKAKEGRRIRYSVEATLPLRHSTQQDKQVGKLLEVLGWKGQTARKKPDKKTKWSKVKR